MEALTLPAGGTVYVDAMAVIYSVELASRTIGLCLNRCGSRPKHGRSK